MGTHSLQLIYLLFVIFTNKLFTENNNFFLLLFVPKILIRFLQIIIEVLANFRSEKQLVVIGAIGPQTRVYKTASTLDPKNTFGGSFNA